MKLARRSLRDLSKSLVLGSEQVVCIGRLQYLVKSKSEDGWHCVDLEPVDADWPEGGCTCRSFTTRRSCRHWTAVRKHLGLETP